MVNIIRRLPKTRLEHKYRHELHCNEVMLLPYYVAAMNIEHTFYEQIGRYEAFPGICLVDTFETAEKAQAELGFFNPENTERVKRQKSAPIFVVLGNPPYNTNQVNENDNNKNRKYAVVDKRLKDSYIADSTAQNRNKLTGDPYVKAFRWASDRLQDEGVVAFVSNNSFVDDNSFNGMRRHLAKDFSKIYVIDLRGNVRRDSMKEGFPIGEAHTIFGLGAMVGISVTLLVRRKTKEPCEINYFTADWRATRSDKFAILDKAGHFGGLTFRQITPSADYHWLNEGIESSYATLMSVGSKAAKAGKGDAIFRTYCIGVVTNRDSWAYNFQREALSENMRKMIEVYNDHIDRWSKEKRRETEIDQFVESDPKKIKWSRDLKEDMARGLRAEFSNTKIRESLFRPFCKKWLFFDAVMNQDITQLPHIFPAAKAEEENRVICFSGTGFRSPFSVLATNRIPELHLCSSKDGFQCFPFYTYDGENNAHRENIPLSTLVRFQQHYADEKITKWDIFHYVYAVLHHPEYRTRYAANLRRELPRIPLIGKHNKTFRVLATIGKKLADLHVNYEEADEHPLKRIENTDEVLNWRVEKMRLTKDKTALLYNDFLTLAGIPEAALAYRLGNRSALEWVIDQYQTSTDARSGITNDPNREDEPDYIVKLIGKVITVSLETQKLIAALPSLETKSETKQ